MMQPDINRQVALVTGGGRGIGLQVVAALARLGMTVLLGARDPRSGEDQAAELRADGAKVQVAPLDVTDSANVHRAATWINERFGRLDVLVNNAGIAGERSTQVPGAVDLDVIGEVFATNVYGVITVTEAALPLLRRAPHPRIVNLSSSLGSLARMSDPEHYFAKMPGSLAYAPSKTALNQVTIQYAKQLQAAGILVNAADPGPCATDFTAGIPGVTRTAADGAAIVVELATLDDNGPTGSYRRSTGTVPW